MAKKRGRPRKNPETTAPAKKEPTVFEKTISKKTDKKGNTRATVMNKAAAELGDESRKRTARSESKYFNSDCIHRPKD